MTKLSRCTAAYAYAAVAGAVVAAAAIAYLVMVKGRRPATTASNMVAERPVQWLGDQVTDISKRKRSSCYDCESQLPADKRWMAQPSSCFDCDAELASKNGNRAGFYGSGTIA